jgi:hypothetical protein
MQNSVARFLLAMCFAVATSAADARSAGAKAPAKPVFYATSAACAAAGIFSRIECDNAFDNASAELRAQRLVFSSRIDCLVEFRLCERQGDDGAYTPVMLGVEIVKGRGGGLATPVLAVPTRQGLLPPQPIASLEGTASELGADGPEPVSLPTDHFQRLDPKDVREASGRFRRPDETFSSVFLLDAPPPRETAQQRRARLQEAPFVE